jgi:15-cis-phytoene desaturase
MNLARYAMATDSSNPPRVAIAGGGLAGLACAKSLVDAGMKVDIFESLPYLGGRASTYRDKDGDWVEQGLHLFFGTYSEFRKLLREIGQPPKKVLFWRDELLFEEPNGPRAVFGINPVHGPLRTFAGFAGNNDYLNALDKASLLPVVAPAVLSMKQLHKYDNQSVYEWWKRTSGRKEVLERFLQPFCRAIQFTDAKEFSAYNFLGWIHHTIYGLPKARLGGYIGARDETIFRPLGKYLTDHGATIRTGTKIVEILHEPDSTPLGRINGFVLDDASVVEADIYVVAMPAWTFAPLIPQPIRNDPFFANIADLPIAPAIAVQLWMDRKVAKSDAYHLLPRTNVVVYQDQTKRTYPYPHGSRLSVDLAPADDMLGWDDEAIVKHTLDTLRAANPAMVKAKVKKWVVLKHPAHLIRPLPGVMTRRPSQVTPVANFFLAGDWTQQEFFGSQEGAVRGGRDCASAIQAHLK